MIDLYQVDAFVEEVFTGNPVAVCPLEIWLPDELHGLCACQPGSILG